MSRILVLNKLSAEGLAILSENFDVEWHANPDGIIVRSMKVDTDNYANVSAIARAGAGVNNITVDKATKRGICVFNTPGANANAVAELVFIMLGVYARRVASALEFVRQLNGTDDEISAKVEAEKSHFSGFELNNKTLGVVGLGKIGVLVANAGIGRGMKVVGYDAHPTLENMHQLNSQVTCAMRMEDVLSKADILSVHVPLKDETRNLIGAGQICPMKPGCVVMNYARSGIYNDAAVIDALDTNRLAAYITDFPTANLLKHERVICTPHLGASTAESEEKCAVMAAKQMTNFLKRGVVSNSVNFPALEVFPSQGTVTRLVVVNKDVPNVIAEVSGILGGAGVNIHAFFNASNGQIGYNLVDVKTDVDEQLIGQIRLLPNVIRTSKICL